jgi:hypothetical protein
MRAKYLLVGALALLLGACSRDKGGHAPPPPNKDLLAGKWKNASELQFLAGYEFADDGTAKVTFRGMKRPVPARYAWTDERTLNLESQAPADVRRAYKAAAKAYKADLRDRAKTGKLHEKALQPLEAAIADELPAAETFRVATSEKPRMLFLTTDGGGTQTFDKAD